MLITEKIKIKMNSKHIQKYKEKGYVCSINDIIDIDIKDVPLRSKINVVVCCDYCGNIKNLKYYSYNDGISTGKYSCQKCSSIKSKENNLKKYGVESINQLESVKNKKKEVLLNKYGVDNISKISQDEVRKTKLNNHGDEKYNNRDKAKTTTMERYGVENYRNTIEYTKKTKITNLKKYGVEHFSQDPIIFRKQQIGGYRLKNYKNLFYRGSYELDFIKYCESNNIDIMNGPSIEYLSGNTKKIYHSDFYISKYNLICEIKSSYYFKMDFDKNILKEKGSINDGYNFIFIIDKNYEEFIKKIKGS